MVGRVLVFLCICDINLCFMIFVRTKKGGVAVLSFEVDGNIDEEVTKFIERFPGVLQCTLLVEAGK